METSRRTASGERRVRYPGRAIPRVVLPRLEVGCSQFPTLSLEATWKLSPFGFSFSLSRHGLIRKKSSVAILEQRLLADFLKTAAAIELGYASLRFKPRKRCRSAGNKQTGREPFDARPAVNYAAMEILLSITTTWFRNPLHLSGPWMAPRILDRCELAGL